MSSPPSEESQRIYRPELFRGHTAIITGGGSGIGLCTARELVRLGGRVAICGRSQDKLDAAAAELRALARATPGDSDNDNVGPAVYAASCDIREADEVERFVGDAHAALGEIDTLVNNAGGQFPSPAEHISAKGFAAVVRNNLLGTFNMTRAVAKQAMIPRQRGRIINIIANIYRGFPGMVHTGAARAGVENMTMTLAVEWARYNIKVNAIAPGIIYSSGTEQYPETILQNAVSQVPLGRAGEVAEVTASILFLASPAAAYITGATLRVDGAQSLRGDPFPM